ncbi:hypothetical protein GCM10012275_55350 [Longimycelium tulufanense]|uniref:Uncharacterized protein n=1 Tax=Longimycelium tulufanense TaxID=907463 RepID=A0A8J3CHD9_9PSEU|nr:hypothetical protein [Longimycelium tulufanense]GGM77568.1 hypothetical protein GCM10012275_55350 [Longimycelium tulufanense]
MRKTFVTVALVGTLAVAAVGAEVSRTSQLRGEVATQVRQVLPASATSEVKVRGFPLLWSSRDGVVDRAESVIRIPDGQRASLVLRRFHVGTGRADWASLAVELPPLGELRSARGSRGPQAEAEQDEGELALSATVEGGVLRVSPTVPIADVATISATLPRAFQRGRIVRISADPKTTVVELRVNDFRTS